MHVFYFIFRTKHIVNSNLLTAQCFNQSKALLRFFPVRDLLASISRCAYNVTGVNLHQQRHVWSLDFS